MFPLAHGFLLPQVKHKMRFPLRRMRLDNRPLELHWLE